MTKRLISLILCLLMLLPMLMACSGSSDKNNNDTEEEEDKGAYIKMYIADVIYDLDPAYSLNNKSVQKIISLLYSGLFKLDENGNYLFHAATTKRNTRANGQ